MTLGASNYGGILRSELREPEQGRVAAPRYAQLLPVSNVGEIARRA